MITVQQVEQWAKDQLVAEEAHVKAHDDAGDMIGAVYHASKVLLLHALLALLKT